MKKFVKILNDIAITADYSSGPPNSEESYSPIFPQGDCCAALYFYDADNVSIKNIIRAYTDYYLTGNPQQDLKNFTTLYIKRTIEALESFLINFCACSEKSIGPSNNKLSKTTGQPPSGPFGSPISEFDCRNKLATIMSGNHINLQNFVSGALVLSFSAHGDSLSSSQKTRITNFIGAFIKCLGFYIDSARAFAGGSVRTDNLFNMFTDLCRVKRQNPRAYKEFLRDARKLYLETFLSEIAREEFEQMIVEMSAPEAPETICVPVLDEETQSSLPAFGISETAIVSCLVGAGLYMGRGPIKSVCRRLLGLNKATTTAAVAACVAASMQRTGTATVNPEDPALRALIGEVLDKTCSESGQTELFRCDDAMEGDGDAGGEVDAPGGGDIGGFIE